MKVIVITMLALISLQAYAVKDIFLCKPGYKKVSRCSALRIIQQPEAQNKFQKMINESTLQMYQDILVCSNAYTPYVQLNVSETDGTNDISPALPAQIRTAGVTHWIDFQMPGVSHAALVFGGIDGKENAQLTIKDFNKNDKSARFVYALNCKL